MAFQKSSSERQHAQMSALQINTATLVQCQKHPAHSWTVPEAAHKYLGFRVDHCMGKRKD